jgi:PEP-CTERM motif
MKSCRVRQMGARLTAMLLVGALASLLGTHPAHATSTLNITATVNNLGQITIDIFGQPYNPAYAGSIVLSSLDATPLPFLYCVDVMHDIYIPGTYYSTGVNTNGMVHNSPVDNAGQVAWLLDQYADAAKGNKDKTAALQVAIWEAMYGTKAIHLNGPASVSNELYSIHSHDAGTASVGNYTWLSPLDAHGVQMQGLVTRVPEPGSTLLLALALSGLSGVSWWRRKR